MAEKNSGDAKKHVYDESKIKTLSSLDHIRLRTGMYIGRIGDGSNLDDGGYILLKEVVDNTIDEFIMGHGKEVVNAPAEKEMKQLAEQVAYDSDVAEQQWGVLQRAQEVTVAKVQPLRANLPTRGQRHSFSQVLQTEVGKEMTIHFAAANTKHIGWFRQTIYVVGAFLALWVLVGALANRDSRRGPAVKA